MAGTGRILLAGTAMAALATIAPAAAWADQQCGIPSDGAIVCNGTHYPDGIRYEDNLGALRLIVTGGADVADGISVIRAGDVTLDIREGARIRNDAGSGIRAISGEGSASIVSFGATTGSKNAHGVVLEGPGGAQLVDRGTIATSGAGAKGAVAISDGHALLDVLSVETQGAEALGIEVDAATAEVRATHVQTNGFYAAGIVAVTRDGDLSITAGEVATAGGSADGIFAAPTNGDMIVRANRIHTSGDDSFGLNLAAAGDAQVEVGQIVTAGGGAHGIVLQGAGGALSITADTILVHGDDAFGVYVANNAPPAAGFTAGLGLIGVTATNIATTGARGGAINATSDGGDIALSVDQVTTGGAQAHAIVAATTGKVTINARSIAATGAEADALRVDAGLVDVRLAGAVAATAGAAVRLAAADRIILTLGAEASLTGRTAGMALSAGNAIALDIASSVSSHDGFAIDAAAPDVRVAVTQHGRIRGAIRVAGGTSRIDNDGIFTLTGDSQFDGADDAFDNRGVVRFAAIASVPASVALNGLERFENRGLIDLRNSVAGDKLTIPGTYDGSTGATLALDVNFDHSAVADQLVVGKATGRTVVRLNPVGARKFGDSGVVVVRSQAVQTGDEFVAGDAGVGSGLIALGLSYDAASHSWTATVRPGARAGEAAKFGSGALSLWRQSADAWSSAISGERRAIRGTGLASWMQGYAGHENIGNRPVIGLGGGNLALDQRAAGVQAGIESAAGGLLLGATFGYDRLDVDFRRSATDVRYSGGNAGIYAAWRRSGFFADALFKIDWWDLKANWAMTEISSRSHGHTLGARLQAGWQGQSGQWFLEPSAGLSWATADIAALKGEAATVSFGRTDSLIGKAGLRTGIALAAGSAVIQPFAELAGYREFRGRNATALTLAGDTPAQFSDTPSKLFGKATLGVDVQSGGWSAFADAQAGLGDITGIAGRAGLRWRW